MGYTVEFKKSGKKVEWDKKYETILELADAHGVEIETICEEGVCGTCKARLLSGKVDMETTDGLEPEDRAEKMILPCVAVPKSDIILDV